MRPSNSSRENHDDELSSSFDRFIADSSNRSKEEGCSTTEGRESPCDSTSSSCSGSTTSTSSNSTTSTSTSPRTQQLKKRASPCIRSSSSNSTPPVQLKIVMNTPPRGSASADTIRSRFLWSLGIASDDVKRAQEALKRQQVTPRTILRKRSPSFQEPLKGDYGLPATASADDELSVSTAGASGSVLSTPGWSFPTSAPWLSLSNQSFRGGGAASSPNTVATTTTTSSSSSTHSSRSVSSSCSLGGAGVSFDSAVTVHPIPNRAAYSERIKNQLWQSPVEMQENAARNCFEFASEGWDWQQVVGDEEMVVHGGERIHPIHFLYYQQQQQQLP